MGRPPDELERALSLTALEFTEEWAAGVFRGLEAAAVERPGDVAARAREIIGSSPDSDVAWERLILLAGHWETAARRSLLTAIAALDLEAAGSVVQASVLGPDDPVDFVPPDVIVAAAARGSGDDAWADELIESVVSEWRWPTIATWLDAAMTAGHEMDPIRTGLDAATWARANPPPSPGTIVATAGPALEADRAWLPYEAWFEPADPRVIRAASEAERVGAIAAT